MKTFWTQGESSHRFFVYFPTDYSETGSADCGCKIYNESRFVYNIYLYEF